MNETLNPVPISDVSIDDSFWNGRLETNREVTLAHELDQIYETNRLENFRLAAGETEGSFEGIYFNDSDVYKWIEAASYELERENDPDLAADLDEVIDLVAGAQEEDGYLNTYFTLVEPEKKWTNLGFMHELYCAGHLFEAAVAHYRATGDEQLLDVARDFADHIDEVFGPDGNTGYPGHEEIELALVKLYEVTGEERYLDLAAFFVDGRGRDDSRFAWELDHLDEIAGTEENDEGYRHLYENDGEYAQDDVPVREAEKVVGHSVRATYLYSGMSAVARETGEDELMDAQERLWENMTKRRMYVTGGIGSAHEHEGFTEDYDLPNDTAYAETCAAVGSMLWNHRLLQAYGEGRFADEIERALYNGFLSGVSRSGTEFFYVNPLASDGDHHRQGWFDCACCPPNVARFLASFHRYVYLTGEDSLLVSLFVGGETTASVDDREVTVRQDTEYPWDGAVTIDVLDVEGDDEFSLDVRIPGWCDDPSLSVDGEAVDLADVTEDGYARLERSWESGDRVELDLPMPVEQIEAHPAVDAAAEKVALRRGPVVFCAEETDNEVPLHQLVVPADADFEAHFDPNLLDGTIVLEGDVLARSGDDWDDLYRTRRDTDLSSVTLTAIPYHLWDHREPGAMRVWLHAR